MYSKRLITVLLFLLLIVSGCTNDVDDKKNPSVIPNAKDTGDYILNVDVLVYKESSDMMQPELTISTAKQHEILRMEDFIQTNTTLQDLPEDLDVTKIYIMTYSYGEGINLKSQNHYMYIQSEDERKFFKKFDYSKEYQMDTFTKEDIPTIMDMIGKKDWVEVDYRPF